MNTINAYRHLPTHQIVRLKEENVLFDLEELPHAIFGFIIRKVIRPIIIYKLQI